MFAEDFSVYFDPDGLGDNVQVGGVDVVGVFTQRGDLAADGAVESYVPVLVVAAADVPGVGHGTDVIAPTGGTAYKVRQVEPDTTGRVLTLYLEAV